VSAALCNQLLGQELLNIEICAYSKSEGIRHHGGNASVMQVLIPRQVSGGSTSCPSLSFSPTEICRGADRSPSARCIIRTRKEIFHSGHPTNIQHH
jgi:hypothetical protein